MEDRRMNTSIFHVDAFASKPFAGNPAGVCLLHRPADVAWMQSVATEMNLSETAFLYPQDDGYNLRWFTPGVEVDLCGHATLASAHVLWETHALRSGDEARFFTRSGLLTAARRDHRIEMDFPAQPDVPTDTSKDLIVALGLTPEYVGRNRTDLIVLVGSELTLRDLSPDFRRLKELTPRGVIVTARSADPTYDFVSRFFAPAAGIDEDPVTGSAHCCLGPFWQNRLGRSEFTAYQASRRGGVVGVRVLGERVALSGQAVTTMVGQLRC